MKPVKLLIALLLALLPSLMRVQADTTVFALLDLTRPGLERVAELHAAGDDKAAAEALKAIGGSGDPAKIADDVKTAQTTLETLRTNHQKEITKIQKNTALRMALANQAHDPADIISLLDLDKIEVDDAGALKTDLDGLLKPLKESKAYLFKSQDPANPDIKGAKPADPGARQEPAAKVDGPVVI